MRRVVRNRVTENITLSEASNLRIYVAIQRFSCSESIIIMLSADTEIGERGGYAWVDLRSPNSGMYRDSFKVFQEALEYAVDCFDEVFEFTSLTEFGEWLKEVA